MLEYIARRAAGGRQFVSVAGAGIIRHLEAEARQAIGDAAEITDMPDPAAAALRRQQLIENARLLQAESDRIRVSMVDTGLSLAPLEPYNSTTEPKLNIPVLRDLWSPLNATTRVETDRAIVLDCGVGKSLSITPAGISLSDAMAGDPLALLLTVRHAQQHWDGKMTVSGDRETRFRFGVAARMMGVETNWLATVPLWRRAEADELARQWQPVLDDIRAGRTASRPAPPAPAPLASIAPATT